MDVLINTALNSVWPQICEPRKLSTPDSSSGEPFSVVSSNLSSVSICTKRGSLICIQREAFLEALRYLATHQHNQHSPCEIRTKQLAKDAGPLCQATRAVNSGTRVISYIVPMLVTTGLVSVRSSRPNAVWLA
jgi:hypothetical protein